MNFSGSKGVSAPEQQFNRACDACRMHKVRCLPNNTATSKTCQRCARTDRQCVYTAPQKRKQRKRTDARVAELEREVQAMRTLFEKKEPGPNRSLPSTSGEGLDDIHAQRPNAADSAESNSSSERKVGKTMVVETRSDSASTPLDLTWSGAPSQEPMGTPAPYSPDSDVIDRGVISLEHATKLWNTYNTSLVHYFPSVSFPPEVTIGELRTTKPTLFLAAIAAASGKEGARLYSILNTEVLSAYAHRTVIQGEKSLELVQALTITSIWYYPPGKYSQLKFYEYIHMAATMALDIGLGTNPKTFRNRRGTDSEGNSPASASLDDVELEKRKTFLTCYLITTR
jgi:hypothetical protein